MSKPTFDPDVGSNLQSWDAPVNDGFQGLYGGPLPNQNPMPIPETTAALPAAADWPRCMIWFFDDPTWKLYVSNGTDWLQISL